MKKKLFAFVSAALFAGVMAAGCGGGQKSAEEAGANPCGAANPCGGEWENPCGAAEEGAAEEGAAEEGAAEEGAAEEGAEENPCGGDW